MDINDEIQRSIEDSFYQNDSQLQKAYLQSIEDAVKNEDYEYTIMIENIYKGRYPEDQIIPKIREKIKPAYTDGSPEVLSRLYTLAATAPIVGFIYISTAALFGAYYLTGIKDYASIGTLAFIASIFSQFTLVRKVNEIKELKESKNAIIHMEMATSWKGMFSVSLPF